MAEAAYEAECMRAELLGVAKPDYEEFMRSRPQVVEMSEEEMETEQLKSKETLSQVSGGLEELNSILQVTQRKIRGFKASCGSLTSLLRIKMGQGGSGSQESLPEVGASEGKALDNHVDRLDAMLEKAENAHLSMTEQNKEMRRFLN